MELKITLMLFVFLVFCLAGNDLYAQVRMGVETHNKGNPYYCNVVGRSFCLVNPLKGFVGFARGNLTLSRWLARFWPISIFWCHESGRIL